MQKPDHEQNVRNAIKVFEGVSGTVSGLLQPPKDLGAEKRGVLVCLGVGTIGVITLSYLNAPWYAYVAEGSLVGIAAILIGQKRGKNG